MPTPVNSDAGIAILSPEAARSFGWPPLHHASGDGPVAVDIDEYIADQRNRMRLTLEREEKRANLLPALDTTLDCVFRPVGPAQPNLKHAIAHVEIGRFLSTIVPDELGIPVDEVLNSVASLDPFQPLQVRPADIRHDPELRRRL